MRKRQKTKKMDLHPSPNNFNTRLLQGQVSGVGKTEPSLPWHQTIEAIMGFNSLVTFDYDIGTNFSRKMQKK